MDDQQLDRAVRTSREISGRLFRELTAADDPIAAVRELAAAVNQLGSAVHELVARQTAPDDSGPPTTESEQQ